MHTRRALLLGTGAVLAAGAGARGEPIMTDEGYYREPWFIESFLDLRDDVAAAREHSKHFALIWELRGCPYCRETHLVNFADPEIVSYIKANFAVLQLNLIGSRKVTDFDHKELAEKELAERYAIRFTPTFQFFPPSADGLDLKEPLAREVARAPGYLKPKHFLAMFRFVGDKAYERGSFRDYLAASKD